MIRYPLIYGFYKENWTRKDDVSTFNIDDILQNGCLGKIALSDYLSDLMYKCGYAPKYGA